MIAKNNTILFVAPSGYPLGGVAIWLDYLVPGLSQSGWKCYVGLVDGKYQRAEEYSRLHPFDKIIKISSRTNTRYERVKGLKQAAIEVGADLVVSINIPDVFEAVSQLKAKGSKIRSVMTLHGLEADYFQDIGAMKNQIDAIIVTNKLTQVMVNSLTEFEQDRTFYAPYGVNVGCDLQHLDLSKPWVISYAGRLEQAQKRCKDLVTLVENLEKANVSYILQIIGEGSLRKSLVQELSVACRNGELRYLGEVSNRELTENILPSTDCLVLTSEWETGPIIVWEAMAAGAIVLSSRYIGSILERALSHRENCLLFDVGDLQQAVKQLEFLESDSAFQDMRNQAFNLVRLRYSKNASIKTWNSVLHLILKDIHEKPAFSLVKTWQLTGRFERIFGHRFADVIRRATGKSAFAATAGDEWPHSYAKVSRDQRKEFAAQLKSLENVQGKTA